MHIISANVSDTAPPEGTTKTLPSDSMDDTRDIPDIPHVGLNQRICPGMLTLYYIMYSDKLAFGN